MRDRNVINPWLLSMNDDNRNGQFLKRLLKGIICFSKTQSKAKPRFIILAAGIWRSLLSLEWQSQHHLCPSFLLLLHHPHQHHLHVICHRFHYLLLWVLLESVKTVLWVIIIVRPQIVGWWSTIALLQEWVPVKTTWIWSKDVKFCVFWFIICYGFVREYSYLVFAETSVWNGGMLGFDLWGRFCF